MAQAYEGGRSRRRNGSARGALKSRANDVLEDFQELRKDMSKLADAVGKVAQSEASHAGTRLGELSDDLRERAAESAAYLRDRANESASYLRERANESASVMGERVRERPLAAVGVSLGIGLLLGLALARR